MSDNPKASNLKASNKPKFNLKLKVDIPDVQPESTHSTNNKKQESDIFLFDQQLSMQQLHQTLSDQTAQFLVADRLVADVAQLKCGRKRQEDRFVAIPNLVLPQQDSHQLQFYYAIFDGHGGHAISTILEQNLHNYLWQDPDFKSDIYLAVHQSFARMNNKILELQDEQKLEGGSTALLVLNREDMLYVVNLGDSTCMLVREDLTLKKMNSEHKLNRQDELQRIEQHGTILDRHSVPRINGELAVTRAFGDQRHRQSGLIAVPEIQTHKVTEHDRFLILASDGFWDIIRAEELKSMLESWTGKGVDQLAQYLLDQAASRNTAFKKDNMTLIALDLRQYFPRP